MKKQFLSYGLFTGCLLFAGLQAGAQNASLENKPVESTFKPGSTVILAPPAPVKSNEPQTAKPIVPGGDFKPMDTRIALPSAEAAESARPKPVINNMPASPAIAPPKTENANPAVPVAIIPQKQQ